MSYTATIFVKDKEVEKVFAGKDFSSERVQVDARVGEEGFTFHIEAKDSVALRAVCNSITKLLTVWEKVNKV